MGWLDDLFGAAGAPSNAQYVTLALNGTLTAERMLAISAGQLSGSDGGAGGSYTLGLATTAVSAGTYQAPAIIVDAYGRITAAGNPTSITLLAGAARTIQVAQTGGDNLTVRAGSNILGAGGTLVLRAGTGTTTDGEVVIHDADGDEALCVGDGPTMSFYGEAPVARQTVNWEVGDADTLKDLMTALVALGLIDGQEIEI